MRQRSDLSYAKHWWPSTQRGRCLNNLGYVDLSSGNIKKWLLVASTASAGAQVAGHGSGIAGFCAVAYDFRVDAGRLFLLGPRTEVSGGRTCRTCGSGQTCQIGGLVDQLISSSDNILFQTLVAFPTPAKVNFLAAFA